MPKRASSPTCSPGSRDTETNRDMPISSMAPRSSAASPNAPGNMASERTGTAATTTVPDLEISGSFVRTARITDEWYRDVEDPAALVEECRRLGNVDVFTFWQRLPFTEPQHDFPMEWDSLAVLPISTFDHWYKRQINNKTRNLIVKARKKGIVVNKAVFDEPFVNGITRIFNETDRKSV